MTTAVDATSFRLVSPEFHNGDRLPRKYTGEGQGAKKSFSPPLKWYNVPEDAESLALVVEDIDAPDPSGTIVPWTHWVVVNVPPDMKGLPEGFSRMEKELGGQFGEIQEGVNDWKVPGWGPPLPPTRGHRYRFKLFALDTLVNLGHKVTKDKLMDYMKGHVLGEAELIVLF